MSVVVLPSRPAFSGLSLTPYLPGLTCSPTPSGAQSLAEKLWLPESMAGARRSFRPIMVLFFGRRGAGKTLALTTTMYFQARRNRVARYPCRITTNYHVTFANHEDAYVLDELMQYPPWAHNLYLGVDEIGSCFPGRRSLASINLLFSQLIGQIRKLATEIGATTRFPQVLDQQHIMEIDLFIRCEQFFFTNGKGKVLTDPYGRPVQGIDMDIWDYWGQWTGDMRRKYWPPYLEPVDGEKRFVNTQYIWPLYQTEEVIAPLWSKSRDAIITRQWDSLESEGQTGGEGGQIIDLQPKTLEGHLTLLGDRPFNITSQLNVAKRFYPDEIKTKRDLAEWLTANGYDVEGQDGSFWAHKKPAGMDIDEAVRMATQGKG